MTVLHRKDPAHWHVTDADGRVRHNMTDPRRHHDGPVVMAHLDADERAYLEHLLRHEELERSVEPRADDPPLVQDVLAYAASERQRIDLLCQLAVIARRELREGVPPERSKAVAALGDVWRSTEQVLHGGAADTPGVGGPADPPHPPSSHQTPPTPETERP